MIEFIFCPFLISAESGVSKYHHIKCVFVFLLFSIQANNIYYVHNIVFTFGYDQNHS